MRGYFYGRNSIKNISSTIEAMQKICHRAMEIANKRKTYCPDFGISRGYSNESEQFELFKKGRSKGKDGEWFVVNPDEIVTNCDGYENVSVHQYRMAIDFFAIHPETGKTDYRPEMLALVATCFFEAASDEGYDLDWGGSFKSISDACHVQIKLK